MTDGCEGILASASVEKPDTEVLTLVEERLTVYKRLVEGERVRVRLVTDEVAELARVSLRSERIEVERVPVGRAVASAGARGGRGDHHSRA